MLTEEIITLITNGVDFVVTEGNSGICRHKFIVFNSNMDSKYFISANDITCIITIGMISNHSFAGVYKLSSITETDFDSIACNGAFTYTAYYDQATVNQLIFALEDKIGEILQ